MDPGHPQLPPVGYVHVPPAPPSSSIYQQPMAEPRADDDASEASQPLGEHLPTPSESSSSSDDESTECGQLDAAKENGIFRPVNFDSCGSAEAGSSGLGRYCPLTPTNSSEDGSPEHTGGITAVLVNQELWESFREIGNEMIVTKPGRRLFPAILANLRGLAPQIEYNIYLRISPADKFRYKFLGSKWVAMGESEIMQNEERQILKHPNSPNLGSFWMKKPISFKSLKITHNPQSKTGNILLHTMHKYIIEIVVQPTQVEFPKAFILPLHDTVFTAVTSYQNTKLTQLKIDNNPFAKGFRDRENMSPLALPPYPSSPLWQIPMTPPLQYSPLGQMATYQFPPPAQAGSHIPMLSYGVAPTPPRSLLPPLLPPLSSPTHHTEEHVTREQQPLTLPTGASAYPLPQFHVPMTDPGTYSRTVPSYNLGWSGPWGRTAPPTSHHHHTDSYMAHHHKDE